jgi:DNA repair photolyase
MAEEHACGMSPEHEPGLMPQFTEELLGHEPEAEKTSAEIFADKVTANTTGGNPMLDFDIEQASLETDPYEYFMKNEPHVNLTPIEVDPVNGLRYTTRKVAMTRGMSEDNKKEMKIYLDPLPHVVLDQNIPLRGWYKGKHEADNTRPRPCMTDAILTQPYGGFCAVGCGFCYINHGMRGYRSQGLATVDPNYGEKCRKQFAKMNIAPAVYMSSFIDPFLELEDVYHNTQNTAQAAVDCGLPIFFLTRKTAPGWAYDLLKKNKYSYMQFSINTSDPEKWRRLSPRANPLEVQFEQVAEMHRQGIYVSIQVNPIVPGVVDNADIVRLIHRLAEAGADHLIFKFVEITFPSAQALIKQIAMRFGPAKGKEFGDLFTCNIGGWKTIDETYRKAALDLFSAECKKAGVTMALCYEYEFERDKEGKVIRSRGASMNAKYLTADQCHGHRVPFFFRTDLKAPFEEMKVCPPVGCLTCADGVGGDETKVPCGSALLGSAKALEMKDFKGTAHLDLKKLRVIQ